MNSLRKLAPPPYVELQPAEMSGGGFDGPTLDPVGEPIQAKERRLSGEETVRAGRVSNQRNYRFWCESPIEFDESATLLHPDGSELSVVSIVPYPERGIVQIDAERSN